MENWEIALQIVILGRGQIQRTSLVWANHSTDQCDLGLVGVRSRCLMLKSVYKAFKGLLKIFSPIGEALRVLMQ